MFEKVDLKTKRTKMYNAGQASSLPVQSLMLEPHGVHSGYPRCGHPKPLCRSSRGTRAPWLSTHRGIRIPCVGPHCGTMAVDSVLRDLRPLNMAASIVLRDSGL